jgi:putative acyl-CoA dehydrogenase
VETTHEVLNQVPPLEGYSLYQVDPLMQHLSLPADAKQRLSEFGSQLGEPELIRAGTLANEYPPVLKTHDRYGHRSDTVDFHPAYHRMMAAGMGFGVHCLPWTKDVPDVASHLERAAGHYMLSQIEAGVGCPLTMTFAGVPALKNSASKELQEKWLPKLTAKQYDRRFAPVTEKTAATIGMAMTEKQGGSDVRSNTTQATHQQGDIYTIRGHKWFCSAPMSDAFLILGQTEKGLTCFFVPRWKPDGEINNIRVVRLKNKLGNKSNASSEVEYEDAWAVRVGEEGRGVPTIIEMVNHTRLDCVIGAAALMRGALTQALHHVVHRKAFGALLKDQPLMVNVLADLCLEVEGAWQMIVRLCRAYGLAHKDETERAFTRIGTAVAKFWVCKRAPSMVVECLECLGGAGYTEDFPLARLFRESPLLSVWEGSGNVISLDLLRSFSKEPESLKVFLGELSRSEHVTRQTLEAMVVGQTNPYAARSFAHTLATRWQLQLLENSHTPGAAQVYHECRIKHGSPIFGLHVKEKQSKKILERFLAPFEA